MLPQVLENDISKQIGKTPGGIPLGITRNLQGEAILYYKGSALPPKYLMEIDTLLNGVFNEPFLERVEGVEYFGSFEWDTTLSGYVDIRRPEGGDLVRYYHTQHQPTGMNGGRVWFRKIQATLDNNVVVDIWEKFERD
jgi:hypothetical protein